MEVCRNNGSLRRRRFARSLCNLQDSWSFKRAWSLVTHLQMVTRDHSITRLLVTRSHLQSRLRKKRVYAWLAYEQCLACIDIRCLVVSCLRSSTQAAQQAKPYHTYRQALRHSFDRSILSSSRPQRLIRQPAVHTSAQLLPSGLSGLLGPVCAGPSLILHYYLHNLNSRSPVLKRQ